MKNKALLLDYLTGFLTEHRKALFEEIIQYRTKYLTVVLENIYQPQNASAVLRTCDCFGIQDIHIIENENEYRINPKVVMGATKWLTLNRYNTEKDNTLSCLEQLKSEGYTIVATTPHKSEYTVNELPLDKKTALVFGQELRGLSETVLKNADSFVKIPMYGFTESFNISVSAAITLKVLTDRLHKSNILWQLTENEKNEILLQWARNSIKSVDLIENDFFDRQNKK